MTEWNEETHVAQIDCARATDFILHVAVLKTMRRCFVPEPLALANIRETRRAMMSSEHADWSTRQGWASDKAARWHRCSFGGSSQTACKSCTRHWHHTV